MEGRERRVIPALLGAFALALPAPDPAHAVVGGGVGAVLGWLAATDLRSHRVPNRVILPAVLTLCMIILLWTAATGPGARLGSALVGALGAPLVLLGLAALTRGGVGLGDVKVAALAGLWTGWLDPWAPAVVLVVAFAAGGAAVLVGRARGRLTLAARVPFAPALAVGVVVATWWTRWGF